MAALTVGGTAVDVTAFRELPRTGKGEPIVRTFDMTARSSRHDEKRRFEAEVAPSSKTIYEALETVFADGASFTLTGDILLGDSVTCRGTIEYRLTGTATAVSGYNQVYAMVLHMEQV